MSAPSPTNEPTLQRTAGSTRRVPIKRWHGILLTIFVGMVILVAALPTIVCSSPAVVLNGVGGPTAQITAANLRIGWLTPLRVDQFQLSSPLNEPVLTFDSASSDLTLWNRLCHPKELGTLQVVNPQFLVSFDNNRKTNLSRTFPVDVPELAVTLLIENGSLSFQSEPGSQPWTLGPLNTTARIEPSRSEMPTSIIISPGTLVDHVELTTDICQDLLKFIAPVLAETSRVEGSFSLEMATCHAPLRDVGQGNISGALIIHSMTAGPGPIATSILNLFGVPDEIRLIEESRVDYLVKDHHVHHSGLRFEAGELVVETSGSVGLDETLDMVALVTLPTVDEPQRPVGRALSGRQIRVPIRGTLDKPKIFADGIKASNGPLAELLPTLDEIPWSELIGILRERAGSRRDDAAPRPRRPLQELFDRLRKQDGE